MTRWHGTPMVVFDDMRHYLDPNEYSTTLTRTACGIDFGGLDWSVGSSVEDDRNFCWQCSKVCGLYEHLSFADKVIHAAIMWDADPDDGPIRSALSEAVASYIRYRNAQESEEPPAEEDLE